jgi:hypothetical protein
MTVTTYFYFTEWSSAAHRDKFSSPITLTGSFCFHDDVIDDYWICELSSDSKFVYSISLTNPLVAHHRLEQEETWAMSTTRLYHHHQHRKRVDSDFRISRAKGNSKAPLYRHITFRDNFQQHETQQERSTIECAKRMLASKCVPRCAFHFNYL